MLVEGKMRGKKEYHTRGSRVISHLTTNRAFWSLTSVIERERVLIPEYGGTRKPLCVPSSHAVRSQLRLLQNCSKLAQKLQQ